MPLSVPSPCVLNVTSMYGRAMNPAIVIVPPLNGLASSATGIGGGGGGGGAGRGGRGAARTIGPVGMKRSKRSLSSTLIVPRALRNVPERNWTSTVLYGSFG